VMVLRAALAPLQRCYPVPGRTDMSNETSPHDRVVSHASVSPAPTHNTISHIDINTRTTLD